MFEKIQHIGYLTPNLESAIAWFERSFGGANGGGGPLPKGYAVPSGGRNAYVRFGQVEAEIIEPEDKEGLSQDILTMHHVGYVVANIEQSMEALKAKGFAFAADAPITNVVGQQVLYFDAATTNGAMMHLTQLPAASIDTGVGEGLKIDRIIHAGYLVKDLDEAIAWYVNNLEGTHIGGGASRAFGGGRNAFVNFGRVQVELIEPGDPAFQPADGHNMDHVGYVVGDVTACMGECQAHGLRFAAESPVTNPIGQQVLYFDTETSLGSRMHLTALPS